MKRSKFSLSHYKLLSCDMGGLYPVACMEVLPGDSVQQATSLLVRCSPLLAPVMHPVHIRVHHWYVPLRIIWDELEQFITGGPDGDDDTVPPYITMVNPQLKSLADYLGIPPGTYTMEVSALPFRAYAMIFNEWYRDQDLVDEVPFIKTSGEDTETNTDLVNVAWEKDYFTSARPWEQKGPAVTLPLTGDAPVRGIGAQSGGTAGVQTDLNVLETGQGAATQYPHSLASNSAQGVIMRVTGATDKTPQVFADLSNVSAATVIQLREAFALQRFEEARARWGSRYTEYLRYLGVRSSDARLQRPEYLGGGRQTLQFSEVLQTSEGNDPVGEMRGHGIGAMRSRRYRRFFEEHGIILSLLSIKPKTMYAQSLNRLWSRRTRNDYWQKELQHIGQQEVYNKELYALHSQPDGVFGYQDRYDEYRRQESSIAGEFRTTLLDYWHMARVFSGDPALNSTFIQSVPTKRVFASQETDVLYVMARHSIQARRKVASSGKSFIF